MATLTRWDPFGEMMTLRTMDRLFDDTLRSMGVRESGGRQSAFALALDVSEDEDEYLVRASVPGIAEDDMEITLNDHLLTISGEFKEETEQEGVQYHLRERRYGKFSRSITLPSDLNEEDVKATFESGVLTVQLPKAEKAKPRRIAVHTQKTIEAKAS